MFLLLYFSLFAAASSNLFRTPKSSKVKPRIFIICQVQCVTWSIILIVQDLLISLHCFIFLQDRHNGKWKSSYKQQKSSLSSFVDISCWRLLLLASLFYTNLVLISLSVVFVSAHFTLIYLCTCQDYCRPTILPVLKASWTTYSTHTPRRNVSRRARINSFKNSLNCTTEQSSIIRYKNNNSEGN